MSIKLKRGTYDEYINNHIILENGQLGLVHYTSDSVVEDHYQLVIGDGENELNSLDKILPKPSSNLPESLSNNPTSGSSYKYSREDHVHRLPTPSQLGAVSSINGQIFNNLYLEGDTSKDLEYSQLVMRNSNCLMYWYLDKDGQGVCHFRNTNSSVDKNIWYFNYNSDQTDLLSYFIGTSYDATKLSTSRLINISGDIVNTSNTLFDGSSNITINTTITPFHAVQVPLNQLWIAGTLTNNRTDLYVSIPLSKPIRTTDNVTLSSNTYITVRQGGNYLTGSASSGVLWSSVMSKVSQYISYNIVTLKFRYNTSLSIGTNNDVVSVYLNGALNIGV